jgi:hypothetical protein
MPITSADVIQFPLEDSEIHDLVVQANEIALHIVDRSDLHERDHLERVINVLLGDIAEVMVIKWLQSNDKSAKSSVDKKSGEPDAGHDLIVVSKKTGREVECSVKSSLSVYKNLEQIPDEFRLATKRSELKSINIQVYFWLEPRGNPRVTVPSTNKAAIIGWFTKEDVESDGFTRYATEARETPNIRLREARPMRSLLDYLQ